MNDKDLVFIRSENPDAEPSQRDEQDVTPVVLPTAAASWEELPALAVDSKVLSKNRIVSQNAGQPEAEIFAVLRMKVLHEAQKHGWKRIAITSPTRGCGKSFVASNLAVSLSIHPDLRTVLLDLDLRQPSLNRYFGIDAKHAVADALTGHVPFDQVLNRIGPRLAVGLGANAQSNSGVILGSRMTGEVIAGIEQLYAPDLMLFDTPPVNFLDDLLALSSNIDAVVLVLGGGQSTQEETETAKALIEEHSNLLGLVLNKSGDKAAPSY